MTARNWFRLAALGVLAASCHSVGAGAHAPIATSGKPRAAELSPSARLARANERLELTAYRDAERDFRALVSTPEAGPGALGLGQLLVTTGRYGEAVTVLTPL